MGNMEIEAIERNIKEAKEIADFGAAVERLKANKDFQKVVLKGYFERESIRLVHLKSDDTRQSPESQRAILVQMDAIGVFSGFLGTALQLASIARKQIEQGEAAIEEIHAEGSEQ